MLDCLKRLGHEVETLAVFDNVPAIVEKLTTFAPDLVFNLSESFHHDRSHEPNIPALLELMKVRYTGVRPRRAAALQGQSAGQESARVPPRALAAISWFRIAPIRCATWRASTYPAFVKPVGEESSDGISQASFARDEAEAIERARFIHQKFDCDVLIEEYIEGRELYLSVLGNHRLTVFPPREIFFEQVPEDAPKFATYHAKWNEKYRKKWGIKNGPAKPLPDGVPRTTRAARARRFTACSRSRASDASTCASRPRAKSS